MSAADAASSGGCNSSDGTRTKHAGGLSIQQSNYSSSIFGVPARGRNPCVGLDLGLLLPEEMCFCMLILTDSILEARIRSGRPI